MAFADLKAEADLETEDEPRFVAVLKAAVAAAEKEASAAHGLTDRVLEAVQSDAPRDPLPPIREAMDTLMREASA